LVAYIAYVATAERILGSMIDGIKNRLANVTWAAGELAALLKRPIPPLHESRLAAKLAGIEGELTELLAHTRQLLAAGEEQRT
jgi:hypothetical protein